MNMKRKITKLFATAMLAVILVCSAIFATGCYVIRGVKMKDLKGTYELTHYSARTNLLEEREIKLYLVINNSGDCYYVFKDNDTELYASEMRVSFTANTEDSSKYDYVKCTFYDNYTIDFGINGDILNYSKIVWKPLEWGKPLETDYTISASFKKVSKKTDLSYVANEMDAELTVLPYGLANAGGVYELSGYKLNDITYLTPEEMLAYGEEQPVYAYMRLDVFNNKMTFYTMFASNEVQEEFEENIVITGGNGTYTIMPDNLFVASSGTVIIAEMNLTILQSSRQITQSYEVKDADGNNATLTMVMNYSMPLNYDLTETIANQVAAYGDNKCYYGKHEWTQDDADLCEYEKVCEECGAKEGMNIAHIYDDENDAICNTCGDERQLPIVPPELKPEDENSAE